MLFRYFQQSKKLPSRPVIVAAAVVSGFLDIVSLDSLKALDLSAEQICLNAVFSLQPCSYNMNLAFETQSERLRLTFR